MRTRFAFAGRRLLVASMGLDLIGACARGRASPAAVEPGRLPTTFYAGAPECGGTPPLQVHAYNADFFILRQAACTNFEKPFLYLVFGRDRVLLLDTGAQRVDVATPIDTLIRTWLARHRRAADSIQLVVAHSHAHGDHVAGDSQFVRRPATTVVGRDTASVRAFSVSPTGRQTLGRSILADACWT